MKRGDKRVLLSVLILKRGLRTGAGPPRSFFSTLISSAALIALTNSYHLDVYDTQHDELK